MQKSIATILVCLMVFMAPARNAHAVIVPPVPILAASLGASLIVGATVAYYKPAVTPTISHFISNTTGNLYRVAIAAYNQLNEYNQNQLMGKAIALKATYDDMKNIVLADETSKATYPALASLMQSMPNGIASGDHNSPSPVGLEVQATNTGLWYKITGLAPSYSAEACNLPGQTVSYGTMTVWVPNGKSGCPAGWTNCQGQSYYVTPIAAPTPNIRTAQEFAQSAAPSGGVSSPLVQDELDALITGNVSIVHFADTDLPDKDQDIAPPYVPPAGVSVNPQIAPTVTGLGAQAASSAAAASAAANANYAAAKTAYDQAKDAYDSAPTAENLDALRAAEQALNEAAQAAQAAANAAAQAAAEEESTYPSTSMDTFKTLDFSKWRDLRNIMANTWPFTFLASLAGYASLFLADGSAPQFDLPIYGNVTLHCDLSVFDPVAACVRYVFSIFIVVGGIFGIVRFYRGVV